MQNATNDNYDREIKSGNAISNGLKYSFILWMVLGAIAYAAYRW